MPHSSGGGCSGGGFHGGGGGGFHGAGHTPYGQSKVRYSHIYFPGALCYVYYDRAYNPHLVYTDKKHEKNNKTNLISCLVIGILLILPILFAICTGFHSPKKLKADYDTTIVIDDSADYLNEQEESNIRLTFQKFYDVTGISPALEVINTEHGTHYSSLEDYAYNSYIRRFKDEKHWLIVYATKTSYWSFEGMQGNDTDTILSNTVTSKFDKTLYNDLTMNMPLDESLADSFDTITPNIMKPYFYVDSGAIMFSVACGLVFGGLLVYLIVDTVRARRLDKAVEVTANPTLKKCPYCDSPYYVGSVKKCPKCGAFLDETDSFETDVNNL